MLYYNVNNAGYDYVESLTNSSATHTYIWEWVTWLCLYYQYVDVYFIGHGCDNGLGSYGFVSYDAENSQGYAIPSLEYYSAEMVSYDIHPYDYSELRLGVGAFCYGSNFYFDFIYQGASYPPPPCDRVWIGPTGTSNDEYVEYYLAYWSYYWYLEYYDSSNANDIAINAASPHIGNGETVFSYNYGLEAITFPQPLYWVYITVQDSWGWNLPDAGIKFDYTYVGDGSVSLLVARGYHNVDVTDNPVYDPNVGFDVYVTSGTGDYLIPDTTIITICY
jgi:hypothetical protein